MMFLRKPKFGFLSIKKLFSFLLSVLVIIVFGLVLAIVAVPKVVGAVPLTVLTGSMIPTYSPGDIVVTKPYAKDQNPRIGDVVSYFPMANNPTLITHRIVTKNLSAQGSTYVTQGDANGAADKPITSKQIAGKVIYSVPMVGKITHNLGSTSSRSIVITGAGIILIGYSLLTIAIPSKEKKKKLEV